MKKVIFVCLLTLSVCLSDTAVNVEKPSKPGNETAPPTIPPANATTEATTAHTHVNETTPKEQAKQNTTNVTSMPNNATSNGTTKGSTNNTTDNKTEKPTTPITTVKPAAPNATNPAAPNATNPAAPNATNPAAPTTDKATTVKPTATTAQPHTLQARGFDGASFVGGIILTLGLIAIGFMGFKYYKTQTERNYHTL